MTEDEFNDLRSAAPNRLVKLVGLLKNRDDRTLIYGYTTDRDTFHVYLKDGVIHRVIHGFNMPEGEWDVMSGTEFLPEGLVPNKRIYPEACDAEFCHILKSCGVDLPFTNFTLEREPKQFHGEILSEHRADSPAP